MKYKITIEPVDDAHTISTNVLTPGDGQWNKRINKPMQIVVPLDPVIAGPALLGFLVLVKTETSVSQVYDAVVISGPPT